eukprot:348959_1
MALFRRKKYQQKRWIADEATIKTNNGYLHIKYGEKNHILEFYSDHLGVEQFSTMKQIINTLCTEECSIYLEWLQNNTGAYYYFNLAKVIEQTQNHKALDINILNVSSSEDMKSNEDDDSITLDLDPSCYFDESVLIETRLSINDILIISPLKSMNLGYSDMGIYSKHKLFLGRTPTHDFITKNNIKYVFNCTLRPNEQDNIAKCTERHFNVCKWKMKGKKYVFIPLTPKNDESAIKMNGKEYLDAMVDEINEYMCCGNVLIQCLAGAHRSAFITSCFLYKYGGFKNKTPEQIYTFMKNRRNVVDELGFDKQLKKYQEFVKHVQLD